MSEYIYEWEFDDTKERWTLWYVIALSIVIWLSIWWFFTKQYWMSFIVLLIAWLVYFVDNNSEDNIEVKINDLWIKISETFYNYTNINSYAFIYRWQDAEFLRLFLNKKWIKNIDVKINNNNVDAIKNAIAGNIIEDAKIELTFIEKVIQMLKL